MYLYMSSMNYIKSTLICQLYFYNKEWNELIKRISDYYKQTMHESTQYYEYDGLLHSLPLENR